ncbi:MAG TPA: Gfo/Idh/MocA family oxidoreductase [Candidatus Saccharimonadales bacterium]|nr:Gfo/Idh/MocA family oxidoreductase [Candidatus Saccharimonadales bacterium]
MARKTLRIGVIGIGGVAQVNHLPALKRLPDVEIAALCDTDRDKARRVAQKFGVDRVAGNLDEFLSIEEMDAVHVCTPNYLHAPMSIAALQAGKHVLCEKPLARNSAETEAMVKAAKEADRSLMCAFNQRFRADAQFLKRCMEKKELGNVFYAKTGWLRRPSTWGAENWMSNKKRSGGGVLMDLGVPMLDLALWLLGQPKVLGVNAVSHITDEEAAVEDLGAAFLRLEGGISLTLEVSWTILLEKDFPYCNLWGSSGAALLNPLRLHRGMHGNLVNVTPTMDTGRNVKESYENEIAHFVDSIRRGAPPSSSGEEAHGVMKVMDAIYKSAAQKKEVKVA